VATLGTAITPDHARLLSRYTKRVVINYDSDEAGQKAANKAMLLLDEVGLEVRVLRLTGAKDADEYIRKFGSDAFRSMLGESRTAFDFKLENLLTRYDVSQTEGKIRAARDVASVIADTHSAVERELYASIAAERLGISAEGLSNDVKRIRKNRRKETDAKEHRELVLSARNFGDRINPDAARNPTVAAAEETVLGLLMLYPEHRRAVCDGKVALCEDDFFTALGKRAFAALINMEKSGEGYSFSALGEHFSPDEMGRFERLRQDRASLSNNGIDVLAATAEVLIKEREKRTAAASGDWQSEIMRRRAELKKKKEK
jgi:DNA primase